MGICTAIGAVDAMQRITIPKMKQKLCPIIGGMKIC